MSYRFATLIAIAFAFQAKAEMGFYHTDTLPIHTPPAIAQSAAAVYRLWVPGGDVTMKFAHWAATDLTLKLQAAEGSGDYLTASQLKFCLSTGNDPCLVMNNVNSGSGFLMVRGNLMWTSRSLFVAYVNKWVEALKESEPSLTAAEIQTRLMSMPLPVLTFDQNGQKLPPMTGNKHFVQWASEPYGATFDQPGYIGAFRADVVAIQLPVTLGTPLELASTRAPMGENLFLLGYPQSTIDRYITFGAPDSTGPKRLHISIGAQRTVRESLDRLSIKNSTVRSAAEYLNLNPEVAADWEKSMICADADSETGNVGGPVLNNLGQVVAMVGSQMREYRGSEPSLVFSLMVNLVY